jgi:hypothetical protein
LPLDQGLANLTIAALQVVETPPPFSDTFTAADDTLLSAHTSDTGHTYSAEANRYRINSGTVSVPDTSGVARLTLIDRTFLKANQYVEADIFFSSRVSRRVFAFASRFWNRIFYGRVQRWQQSLDYRQSPEWHLCSVS